MIPQNVQLRSSGEGKSLSHPVGQERAHSHAGNRLLAALPPDVMARLNDDLHLVSLANESVVLSPDHLAKEIAAIEELQSKVLGPDNIGSSQT